MPWKESFVMEERLRVVARLLKGKSMADVCREFGVSRKTGYKLLNRYREKGPPAPLRPLASVASGTWLPHITQTTNPFRSLI